MNTIALHDNLTDDQLEMLDALFEDNLDLMVEDRPMDYLKTNELFTRVVDFDIITKEELQLISSFAHDSMLMFVENYVGEEFNADYNSNIKSSFELYRRLLCLLETM